MRIFVHGWYDHGNLGDESYKFSFKNIWPNHDFIFSDVLLDEDIDKYDLCILGGGDVVRKESLLLISKLECTKIAVSVTITNQSLDPQLNNLDHIYVRDMSSYNKLLEYGYTKTTYIPDISLILNGDKKRGKKLISKLFKKDNLDLYDKVYTIVVNSHLLGNSESMSSDKTVFLKMIDDVSSVIDRTSASFLFIPFSTKFPWDDRITNGLVNSYTKFYKKNCVIYDNLSVTNSIDIISASDMVITSRFHGLIFGLGNGIPVVTISSHDKISGFCETINEDYINYFEISAKKLEDNIKESKSNKIFDSNKIKNEYLEKVYFLRE
jgi:polysaccharide pyruvyl transferase WcaK-like protein